MNAVELRKRFAEEYGYEEGVRIFFAPGRVNLIGEHTDYNGGYVFPAALTFGTWAAVCPREDGIYRFQSTNFEKKVESSVSELIYKEEDDWANYPKGVLKELLLELAGPEKFNHYNGADFLFYGNIPNGAGLSSSASIELVTGLALSKLAGIDIPMIELVKLAQRAENCFVGVNCGIMDQFAVGMGKKGQAMALKCDTLEYHYVPVKIDGYKIVITNTNKRRGLADSKYNERRSECEQGLELIHAEMPHVKSLGDVSLEGWEKVRHVIKDDVISRRIEHVITENERVIEAMKALEENDINQFGRLMKKSHESLRDFYEVTGVELDTLFEEASKIDGCIGTRMTGAGFGGCNVSFVKEDAVDTFKAKVAEKYTEKTGLVPTFYICEIGDGAKEMI
ncbi:galactokinase [Metabacillus rhizolycopersici]|uniref:Galactokinase n=1 Tax=Metabacillus rhizolycopersici TaxID=2875709 RepID=A0ABS7UXT3_9BACI|nr:galactokinase [Metabacillus rhizolycopersici]MBZ5753120.1 galactokinase [Metabacillus rhizolycopersici]